MFFTPAGKLLRTSEKPIKEELIEEPEAGPVTLVPTSVGGAVRVGGAPAPEMRELVAVRELVRL